MNYNQRSIIRDASKDLYITSVTSIIEKVINNIIEDVKSPITRNNQVYKLKKKIMMYKGYEVRET